jgi:uncharacterized protein
VKLHRAGAPAFNTFTGYGDGYVAVNGQRHEKSVIVLPDRIVEWSAKSFAALEAADFAACEGLGIDILLLGTGPKQRFPHPRLTASLARARIGLEVMDVQAACRTYNILAAEERKVAAALLFQ